jgi:hypothetical protein
METSQRRDTITRTAREVYANIDGNRGYALTPTAVSDLGGLAAAFIEAGGSLATGEGTDNRKKFAAFLQRLGTYIPELFQDRPGDKKELPQVWRHLITNEPLPPPKGADERSLLQKYDPELLQWFDDMEKHPYQTVLEHREREAERQALIGIPYGAKEHETNPFRGNNVTEQSEFQKREPKLAEFFQREAKPVDLELFGRDRNLTLEGKLHRDTELAGIVRLARVIKKQWLDADRQAAAEAKAKVEAEIERLQKQIA